MSALPGDRGRLEGGDLRIREGRFFLGGAGGFKPAISSVLTVFSLEVDDADLVVVGVGHVEVRARHAQAAGLVEAGRVVGRRPARRSPTRVSTVRVAGSQTLILLL